MKKITNLTNSPFDLQGVDGPIRLPAFGSVEGEFSGEYLGLLEASMAVCVEGVESPVPELGPTIAYCQQDADVDADADADADARVQYEALAGKPVDKRWSDKRVAEEIAKLQEA